MATDVLLTLHFVGLMLGAAGGTGSALITSRIPKSPPEHAPALRALGPFMVRVANIGLGVLIVTGLALVWLRYGGLAGLPGLFWVKMAFVATLALAGLGIELTYAEIAKGNAAAAARLPKLGPLAGLSSLLAVVFAVLAFH